jgi:transposase-like protein
LSDFQSESDVRFVGSVPDLETRPPKQRRYTAAYKLRLIDMVDACTAPGELASLLRKEGIYSSTLTDFRKQKARGDLDRKPGSGRAPKASVAESQTVKQLAASERENRRLRRELEKARILLDLQKKVSELMGISLDPQE